MCDVRISKVVSIDRVNEINSRRGPHTRENMMLSAWESFLLGKVVPGAPKRYEMAFTGSLYSNIGIHKQYRYTIKGRLDLLSNADSWATLTPMRTCIHPNTSAYRDRCLHRCNIP